MKCYHPPHYLTTAFLYTFSAVCIFNYSSSLFLHCRPVIEEMDSRDPEESWTPFEIDTISSFCKEVHRRAAELAPKPEPKQTRKNQSRKPKRAPKPRSKAERSRQAAEQRQTRKLKSTPPTSVPTPKSNTTPVITTEVSATPPVAVEAPARTGFPIKLFHRPLSCTELEWIKSHGGGVKEGMTDWEVCAVEFQKKFQRKVSGKILQRKWADWRGKRSMTPVGIVKFKKD